MGCVCSDELVLVGRDRLHDLPGQYRVVRCAGCGLMRTNPRPTPETIGFYYPQDYAPYHIPPASAQASPTKKKKHRWYYPLRAWLRERLKSPEPRALPIHPPGRMLEIGCANGAYMVEARRIGWDVDGIEFSEEAAAAARKTGFKVLTSTIENAPQPQEPYDLITGWMVFEHLHDPLQAFRRLRSWVKPAGWIAFSVPDAAAFEFKLFGPRWYALQVPAHMTHFTPETIRNLLQKAGWQTTKIIWHRNPNNLLNSIRYWALDHGYPRLAGLMADMVAGRRLRKLHHRLARLLGFFKQSGRMTVWAQRIESL